MKKTIIFSLLIVFGLVCLTGCYTDTNKEEVDILFKQLEKEKIVDKDLKLIETFYEQSNGYIPYSDVYYVYEDNHQKLTVIHYETNHSSKDDYNYFIKIYYDVDVNNNVQLYDNVESLDYWVFYSYGDGTYSTDKKYVLDNLKQYKVKKEKKLFFTKYKFELDK